MSGCVSRFACTDSSCEVAVIVEPTAQGRNELAAVLAEALHRRKVTVSDDALRGVPTLIVDRSPAHDERGLPLDGRDLSKPDVFRLYRHQAQCVLVHLATQRQWSLTKIHCVGIER